MILKRSRPIVFWGGTQDAKLLSRAIEQCRLKLRRDLEVVTRYSLDTRVLQIPNNPKHSYLALIIDVNTSNVLDVPLHDLIKAGLDLRGRYVCRRPLGQEDLFRPKTDLLGAVAEVEEEYLFLTDNVGEDRVPISDVWLEPRQENLEAVVRALYPRDAERILMRLAALRADQTTAKGQLDRVQQILDGLKGRHTVTTVDGLTMQLTDLLTPESPLFPKQIATGRPNLLFGPQGWNSSLYPDPALQQWGPFKYMQNEKNEPVIVVVCEAQHLGRMEQFVQDLCHGFPDEMWEAATSWQQNKQDNPYRGGLAGKFRLRRITLEYQEVATPDAPSYRQAINRVLARLPKAPDLAIVQVRREFEYLYGEKNPYLVAKAMFMQAGIPVQAVHAETIEADHFQLPRILNNMGLASYAKLGGVPWVISTRNPTSHELVIGMGYTEIGSTRLGKKSRYVGITTLFQGDGRYQVWGLTREVEFDDYATALLENLRTTVRYVREKNDWQPGDAVRLIFHVYKPLKHKEMDAIKKLVADLILDLYGVRYAFLDISQHHAYHLFDPTQKGFEYGSGRQRARRGVGVPDRGLALQMDARTALLHLTGPRDLKIKHQGLPRPLRVELHEQSDFDDLTYLIR